MKKIILKIKAYFSKKKIAEHGCGYFETNDWFIHVVYSNEDKCFVKVGNKRDSFFTLWMSKSDIFNEIDRALKL